MPPPAKPNRYELPVTSMVGAMLAVLAVVVVFVLWRAVNRDNQAVPAPTVDYKAWVRASHQDGRLETLAPARLPAGWRATSASYTGGMIPHWHLGLLTSGEKYIGVEESLAPVSGQVHQYVDANATQGKPVSLDGHTWQTWTDSGGDYAVLRRLQAPKGKTAETVLVVGSAPPAQVRSFARSLH